MGMINISRCSRVIRVNSRRNEIDRAARSPALTAGLSCVRINQSHHSRRINRPGRQHYVASDQRKRPFALSACRVLLLQGTDSWQ